MKKRFAAFAAALVVIFQSIAVFAADGNMIFTRVDYFSAKIYVCDTTSGEAILKNVVPVTGIRNEEVTAELEYCALPLNIKGIYDLKGNLLTMEQVNATKLDAPVRVLIAKNGFGNRILRMDVLR